MRGAGHSSQDASDRWAVVVALPLMIAITAGATFCATLVDEWIRGGVTVAFVAPGSRSTPLALALTTRPELRVHVMHDERAAGFAALGHGMASGMAAVALCSSGTAGTHFHAAVVEADRSAVPLLVVTADRPPELWHIGAPQTIDQTNLFGSSPRFFAEPGLPTEQTESHWRSLGSRSLLEATGWSGRAGPVHLNLSFSDPLVGIAGELPPGRADNAPWHTSPPPSAAVLPTPPTLTSRRGVIIAGHGTSNPNAVLALADALGWPVLADHRSGCRSIGTIAHFDSLLRIPKFAEKTKPEVILRFGEPLASKVLSQWIAGSGAEVISVVPQGRWLDPERTASLVINDARAVLSLLAGVDSEPMKEVDLWRWTDLLASEAIDDVLAAAPQPSEPEIAREVLAGVEAGTALVVASSMPIRDVEWFAPVRDDIAVYANRGANGIDGVVSTAIGVASTGVPTTCLLGDVALLHDSTALIGLARRPVDLTIVVIDNDGGGIFSFLPQQEQVEADRFEQLFGTPHGTDLVALAAAHGIPVSAWGQTTPASSALEARVRMIVARTDRTTNVALHTRLHDAVAEAVTAVL